MRYRYRYDIGPLFMDRPFGRGPVTGFLDGLLSVIWYVVAFIVQLVVWAVLLVVGIIYTLGWLIVWPFHRLFAGPRPGPTP